jgi:hypothetical protein
MTAPRFSIVIPTRNRADTLPFTLRTCLAQEFDDFEIVVADNQSTPPVSDVLAEFVDKRIKHVRTPGALAMTDSWEFAVSQANGEYITVVGGDDGLLLHALREIDRLVRLLDAEILRWESACYNWPDLPSQEYALAHALLIPLKQANDYYPIHRRDSTAVIPQAANSRISYTELPMIQNSAIHRRVIERLRLRTSRVFRSQCPDVYSSFAFAAVAGCYYSVAAPMSINGLSARSNGVACVYLKEQSPIAEDFCRLNAQAHHSWHPRVPAVPLIPAYVADSFLYAQESVFPLEQTDVLDRRQLTENCINEARLQDEGEWSQLRSAIRRSLADDRHLLDWFDAQYGNIALASLKQTRHRYKRYGGHYLYLDASDFGVANILEAAELCEKLLGCKRDGLNCHVVPDTNASAPTTHRPSQHPTKQFFATGIWSRLRDAARVTFRS